MNTDSAAALQRYADTKILSWGLAHALASENHKGIIDGTLSSEVASRRMADLTEAEEKMLALPDLVSPPQLIRFRKAKVDTTCGPCWFSSRHPLKHPACARRITEYFDAEESLLEWIASRIRIPAGAGTEKGNG